MTHRKKKCEALTQPQTDPWDDCIFTYTFTYIYHIMLANNVGKHTIVPWSIFSGTSKFLSMTPGLPINVPCHPGCLHLFSKSVSPVAKDIASPNGAGFPHGHHPNTRINVYDIIKYNIYIRIYIPTYIWLIFTANVYK